MVLDDSLNIIENLTLPGLYISSKGLIDVKQSKIYFNELDDRLVSVDLNTMNYQVVKPPFWISLESVDKTGLIYGVKVTPAMSTLCVLDSEMNLISKHSLKGGILSVQESETGMHAIACSGNIGEWGFIEDDSFVRVYRIDPI